MKRLPHDETSKSKTPSCVTLTGANDIMKISKNVSRLIHNRIGSAKTGVPLEHQPNSVKMKIDRESARI
jgi:hypothetical protein